MPITLNPTDATWLLLESREMPMHVGNLMEFTLPGDSQDFLRTWLEDLRQERTYPSPWNRVPMHAPGIGPVPLMTESQDVDLEHHVRHWGLPKPGGQRELGILVSHLHSQQLDMHRPLWEFHIIEGLEGDRLALFSKVHHSLIDGVTAMRMLAKTMSENPDERGMPNFFEISRGPRTQTEAASDPLGDAFAAARSGVASLGGIAQGTFRFLRGQATTTEAATAYRNPTTPLSGKIKGQRRLATQQYDFDHIRRLAKAADATVNDIVLYLCGTSLRTYLTNNATVPDTSLTGAIPINLRTAGDERAGTVVGMMIAELGTHIEDPQERLDAIKRSTAAAKANLESLSPQAVLAYSAALEGPWVSGLLAGLADKTPAPQSLTISNVPGPRKPLYWNGARLDAMYPMSMVMHGNALNITCISYAGSLNFGFTGARDNLPHLQQLATNMREALDELSRILL